MRCPNYRLETSGKHNNNFHRPVSTELALELLDDDIAEKVISARAKRDARQVSGDEHSSNQSLKEEVNLEIQQEYPDIKKRAKKNAEEEIRENLKNERSQFKRDREEDEYVNGKSKKRKRAKGFIRYFRFFELNF